MSFSVMPDEYNGSEESASTDPSKCYFDYWFLTLFPKGVKVLLSNA